MNSEQRLTAIHGIISMARPFNVLVGTIGVLSCGLIADTAAADWTAVSIAAAAAGLLNAAANIINDTFDVATDRINKPHRAIVSGRASVAQGRFAAALLGIIGLVLSALVGFVPFAIAAAAVALMYSYSARCKGVPLLGNAVVGLVTGLAFPFGCAAAGDLASGIIPGIFAFLFSMGRELIKDAEDIEGDRAAGIVTFASREGPQSAVHMAGMLLFLVILISPLPWFYGLYSSLYLWTALFGVDAVLLVIMISLWRDSSRPRLARASLLLKADMLVGIAAIALGS